MSFETNPSAPALASALKVLDDIDYRVKEVTIEDHGFMLSFIVGDDEWALQGAYDA